MRRALILLVLLAILWVGTTSAQDAPVITHGPLSGEVSSDAVTLWARGNQAGTLTFTVSPVSDSSSAAYSAEVVIDATSDMIGETRIEGLTPATSYLYQVALNGGEAKSGSFTTAPAPDNAAAFNFVFGACLGGQGYCRKPEGGWLIFDQMLATKPDFYIATGDTIYVDSACPVETNVAGAETIARDLEGYRARYRYHLEDATYAHFLAHTPAYVTWDDHEVLDNFGGLELNRLNPRMFAEGQQAFLEYWPLASEGPIHRSFNYGANAEFFVLDTRSFRDPLVNWDPSPRTLKHKSMLGAEQFAWLQAGLADSSATWKFIVSSVPLAYPTGFPQPEVDGRDGWANGADRSGYEHELMALLFYIEAHHIENVVFLTGDTHWPYAISYDPDADGEPNFYELSSSPLSAIVLPPAAVDLTFNPTVLYAEGEFQGDLFNFGNVQVEADGTLTYQVMDSNGVERFALTLEPQ